MTTPRKFSLFIALVALVSTLACEKKKPIPAERAPVEAEESPPDNLEARCFEGDPEACDELGH